MECSNGGLHRHKDPFTYTEVVSPMMEKTRVPRENQWASGRQFISNRAPRSAQEGLGPWG